MLCDCCTSVTLHVAVTNLSAKGQLVVKLTLKGNMLLGVLIVAYDRSVPDVANVRENPMCTSRHNGNIANCEWRENH